MKEFNIYVQNKAGALAEVCEALAKRGVNIIAISTESVSKTERVGKGLTRGKMATALIRVVTSDEATTKSALEAGGIPYSETEILPLRLIDRPGELAKVTRKFSDAGVWIESVYILGSEDGKTGVAFTVDNLSKAREALKRQ